MTAPACAYPRHVSSPVALILPHNNIAVYLNISFTTAQTPKSLCDLRTTVAYMTEQPKGYHIIRDAPVGEDAWDTMKKFYVKHRGMEITDKTHTIVFKVVELPPALGGIVRTYPPAKLSTMEIIVWYPESSFTIDQNDESGPAIVILWDFNVPLEVPPNTKTIKSRIVYRNS